MLCVCLFKCKRVTSIANMNRLSYTFVISYFITSASSKDAKVHNRIMYDIFLFPHLYYVVIGYTFIKILHVYVCLNTQYSINKYATGVSLKKICTYVLSILPFSRMYWHRYFYLIWVQTFCKENTESFCNIESNYIDTKNEDPLSKRTNK